MLAIILYTVLGLVVIVVVVGLLLPSRVLVERAVVIDQPAEAIFPWIADLKLWPRWSVWNRTEDPTLAYTYDGATTGRGGAMRWTARKMGNGCLTITEFVPNQVLRYELRMEGRGMVVRGNIELESAGGGATRVDWFDEVDLGHNPLRKWLGFVIRPMLGRAFERSLAGLKTAAQTGQASGPGPK